MPTAQERFNQMMREKVAPALRQLGFKGSGQSFSLPSEAHWALIGFQKSVYSTAARLEFTLNLTVVSKSHWDAARLRKPFYPVRPSPNTYFGLYMWQKRIAQLMPGGGADHWWVLLSDADPDPVAQEVVDAIRDFGLPAMRDQIDAGAPDIKRMMET